VTEMGCDVIWTKIEECLAVQKTHKKLVYVFEDFVGPAFEHLRQLGLR